MRSVILHQHRVALEKRAQDSDIPHSSRLLSLHYPTLDNVLHEHDVEEGDERTVVGVGLLLVALLK